MTSRWRVVLPFVSLLFALPAAAQDLDYLTIAPLPGNNVLGENVGCVRPAGGGVPAATEQFTALGWNNGPNGIPEDGGGDDIPLGPVAASWSWVPVEIPPAYGNPPPSDIGAIDPVTGLFTAASTGFTARGLVTATAPGAMPVSVDLYVLVPDFVQDPPRAVFAIECTVTDDDVTLTWRNGESYSSVVILRDGATVGVLAGDATAFVDSNVSAGAHTYIVLGENNGEASPDRVCVAGVGVDQPVQLVWLPWESSPSGDESVAALTTALDNLGVPFAIVSELVGLELEKFGLVWATMGLLFPDNHVLSPWEGEKLAKFLEKGGRVYMEGGDIWSQNDPVTRFHELAEIEATAIFTGSVNSLTGTGENDCDFSPLGATYSGEDFQIDRIGPVSANAFTIWLRNVGPDGIGVFSETKGTPGRVIGTSWFLGGYDGDTTALIAAYLDCLQPLTGGQFRRGDTNGDGEYTLPDPLLALNHMFLSVPVTCQDAVDFDDNETLALPDPLGLLFFLFLSGPPPPPPFPGCGPDPAGDVLRCPDGGCP